MNERLELNLKFKAEDLHRKYVSLEQTKLKLEKIQDHLETLERGIQRDLLAIHNMEAQLTPYSNAAKEANRSAENAKLLSEKIQLIRKILNERNPKAWPAIQELLPEVYKDVNLPD